MTNPPRFPWRRAALAVTALALGLANSADASQPPAGAAIPAGRYSRTVTQADGEALGLDPDLVGEIVGADGELPLAIELDGDRWTFYVTNDVGIVEIGTAGPYSYDTDGNLVTEEDCCEGSAVYSWALADDALTLTIVGGDSSGRTVDPVEVSIGRFLFNGDWVLEDQLAASTEPVATVTLRFANPLVGAPPQLSAFVEAVQRAAGGSIEFEWLLDYEGDEPQIIADLTDSAIDIAWVGTRALPAFDVLQAPLLIDSHDLQQAVFEAGIPARMLGDLDDGLVGIAVLPGPLRRVMGVERSFTAPADFAGAVIAGLPEATATALGATPMTAAEGMTLDDLDAVAAQFQAIWGNDYHTQAHSVAANLVLFPRPLLIAMSAESFAALTPEQQDALLMAGAAAVSPAMEASREEDAEHGALLCDAPIDVIESTDAELAEFAAALEPVYTELASDATNAAALDEIEAIKAELGAPPDTLICP